MVHLYSSSVVCLQFAYIVRPHTWRMPQKTVNCFIFVCFRRCKNSTPVLTLAYKSTAAVASALQKDQTATALLTRCKVHAAAFVSVVSAVCLVRFLTLVSNYPKSQRSSAARLRFCCLRARGYCSRRSFPLCPRRPLYLPAKLIPFYHTTK